MSFNKIIVIIILLGVVVGLAAEDYDKDDYRIFSNTGKEVSLNKMAKQLKDYDVILFGEWHDDVLLHQLEAEILPLLDKKNNLAISMEMFERDVQSILDEFLAGKLAEDEFLQKSRAWGNYPTDYKPIIEYAKKHKLDVLAANIPRRYASLVSKLGVGAIDTLPEIEKQFIASEVKPLDNQYKKQFMETMAASMGRKNAMGMSKMLENIFAAQCSKDDTMAESIYEYLQKNSDTQVIHYNGNFHSESHLGTANKLQLLNPNLKIAVISPVMVGDDEAVEYKSEAKELGDWLIFAHRFVLVEEKAQVQPKMFHNISNAITKHQINLTINPTEKSLKGYDKVTFSREISAKDTILLLSTLEVTKISSVDKKVKFQITKKNEDFQEITLQKDLNSKVLKIEYGGEIYFPLKGRELNQTHDGTKGIISDDPTEGIYLPGGNWYPFAGDNLADFDVTVNCSEDFKLLCSGRESRKMADRNIIYNWESELPVDHIVLVGNRFNVKSRMVDDVALKTYLLEEDAKFADIYLDGMEKYLIEYSALFGEYPFSSFSVVENFFASGFGMPNFTLLAKEIVKMPFITLSPGVIAHEFCHNWWGNSVYVDYEKGNWCEAVTVFSANYYQNILNDNVDKAADWRKKAILENNLLPKEKQFPLKDFIYQHNDDEAVIGYQKGAMLFVYLHQQFGEKPFFAAIRDFYKTNKGKVTNWQDLENAFIENQPKELDISVADTFDFWLNYIDLAHISFADVRYENGILSCIISNNAPLTMQIPLKISMTDGDILEKMINLKGDKTSVEFALSSQPESIEIDPKGFLLKKISEQSMPYNLNRTLNDAPLVILPEKGEMSSRLQMVASMLARSGYDITVKSANEVTDAELENNSLLIFGEVENNNIYDKIAFPEDIKLSDTSIEISGKSVSGSKGSAIFSFCSQLNEEKSISVYVWNSCEAIASFRKMFHYMNDSWQMFDLDKKENAALNSGQIFPKGENDLIYHF